MRTCKLISGRRLQRKGGCRTWQEGVAAWIARSGVIARSHFDVRVYAVATEETDAAHALFSLSLGGASFFVDYKGVWTPQELQIRLAREYQQDGYCLKPWAQLDPRWVMIPFDPGIARRVEDALFETVGPFVPSHFLGLPEPGFA